MVAIYLGLVAIVSGFAWRRLKVNAEDFWVASRRLGFLVTFLSISATYHSAFAVLTSTAVSATQGVAWWVGSFAWTTVAALVVWLIGPRMWHLGRRYGYVTLADMISDFYQSRGLRILVASVMAVFVVPYVTVQAIAYGLILDIGSGGAIPYEVGALALSLVTVAYIIVGGQRASSWVDVLQGIWMYVVVWVVAILVVVNAVGGPTALIDRILATRPQLLTVSGTGFSAPLALFSSVLLFGLALPITMQHLQMKLYAARDPPTIKWSAVATAVYLSSLYIPAVFTGLTVAYLAGTGGMPSMAQIVATYGTEDAALPLLAVRYAPVLFVGVLFAGALAAAMSTQDNFFMATAVVVTHDIYRKGFRPAASERLVVNLGRVVMVALAFVGWYLAVLRPGLIFDLVSLSIAGVLQFVPAVFSIVFPARRVWLTKAGVGVGIAVGEIVTLLTLFGSRIGLPIPVNPFTLHAGVWGLIANLGVAFLVSLWTTPPTPEAQKRIHGFLEDQLYGGKAPSRAGPEDVSIAAKPSVGAADGSRSASRPLDNH
ncbi:MAG TPA: sodium:solute symporter family protein [Thermoplasmata archaeon]|nr:sodium:solute symporter family protein [Thermoplasmata archaeon]